MDFKLTLTIPIEDSLTKVLTKYRGMVLTSDLDTTIIEDVIALLNTTLESIDSQDEEESKSPSSASIMS